MPDPRLDPKVIKAMREMCSSAEMLSVADDICRAIAEWPDPLSVNTMSIYDYATEAWLACRAHVGKETGHE